LPIVWLASNPNGQGAAAAEGGLYDDQVDRLDQAVKQRMPDKCAADALPYVGDNSGLIQGAQESDLTFRARCKDKDAQWALAGTWGELLWQLYWTCGLEAGSTFIVQQNGIATSLLQNPQSATEPPIVKRQVLGKNPTLPGQNPLAAIVVTIVTPGDLGTMTFTAEIGGVTYGPIDSWLDTSFTYFVPGTHTAVVFQDDGPYVAASTATIATDGTITTGGGWAGTIEQNSSPWWTFDDRDDLCSRFALILNGPLPTSICPTARATFTSGSSAVATWPYPFDGADYDTLWSLTSTDGTIPIVSITAQDANTVTVTASASFTGYVDVLGWPVGGNPFAGASQSMQNLIALLCDRWKPAKAKFMGTIVDVSGALWGWPVGLEWGQAGLVWGDSLVEMF
jgi:hypothetical protein